MKETTKQRLTTTLMGRAYAEDERVRASVDRAGLVSFLVVWNLTLVAGVAGIILNDVALVVVSLVLMVSGAICYLVAITLTGAFEFSLRGRTPLRRFVRNASAGLGFGAGVFGIWLAQSWPPSSEAVFKEVLFSLMEGAVFILLLRGLLVLLRTISRAMLKKKIEPEN